MKTNAEDCRKIPNSEILVSRTENIAALSYEVKALADDLYSYFYGNFPKNAVPKLAASDKASGLYDTLMQSLENIENNLCDIRRAVIECK